MPATAYRSIALVNAAARFRVRFDKGAFVYGVLAGDTLDVAAPAPVRTINGFDLLQELGHYSLGWWCFFDSDPLSTVVLPAILAPAGWAVGTLDSGLGNFYGRFDGDSCLAALIKVVQQTPGKHFRMGSTLRTLDFEAFGTVSSVRFTNVHHALAAQDNNDHIAIISALQVVRTVPRS